LVDEKGSCWVASLAFSKAVPLAGSSVDDWAVSSVDLSAVALVGQLGVQLVVQSVAY